MDLFDWTPPKYPNEPGYKEHGTSKDAAEAMKPRRAGLMALALAELERIKPKTLTADQIARRLGKTELAIRPRITELYKLGLIERHGERRPNVSGLNAYAYRIKEQG